MHWIYDKSERVESGCWEWTGTCAGSGYPQVQIDKSYWSVHRLSLSLSGVDVSGYVVRHTCDNKKCINPDHLEIGTQRQNIDDAMERGLTPKGSSIPSSKLSESDIPVIRQRLSSGETCTNIAKSYGVSHTVISLIKRNKTWKHVNSPFPSFLLIFSEICAPNMAWLRLV